MLVNENNVPLCECIAVHASVDADAREVVDLQCLLYDDISLAERNIVAREIVFRTPYPGKSLEPLEFNLRIFQHFRG